MFDIAIGRVGADEAHEPVRFGAEPGGDLHGDAALGRGEPRVRDTYEQTESAWRRHDMTVDRRGARTAHRFGRR